MFAQKFGIISPYSEKFPISLEVTRLFRDTTQLAVTVIKIIHDNILVNNMITVNEMTKYLLNCINANECVEQTVGIT